MLHWFRVIKCRLMGHLWVSWHSIEWMCLNCGKVIKSVDKMKPQDRLHYRG